MDQQTIIAIVIAVAVIAAIALAWFLLKRRQQRRQQRDAMRERYGPEYDRTARTLGGEKPALDELEDRERRHFGLPLRELDDSEKDLVRQHMAALQYRFVEDPGETLLELNRVVTEVVRVRGYPIADDREEGLRMLAVDYPRASQPVRALVDGDYGADAARQRQLFLANREALRIIAGINYDLRDAARGASAPSADGQPGGPGQEPDDTAAFGLAEHQEIRVDEPAEHTSAR